MHPWLNWIEHRPPKAEIAGSNPAGCTKKSIGDLYMSKGIVYIVRNPAFAHLIKIGLTTKSCVEDRGLNASNVPEDYEVLYAYNCDNIEEVESHLHELFKFYRHYTTTGRLTEFFYIGCLTNAKTSLKMLEKSGAQDVTEEFQEDIEEQRDSEDNKYDETKIIKSAPSKRFNFNMLKIPIGATLHFFKDESKTCEVISEDKVIYMGEVFSLSSLALKLVKEMGYDWPTIQGSAYFTYNSELLTEIRKRLENSFC